MFFEFKFILKAHLAECNKNGAHTFTEASLELVWWHIQINVKLL
jgi:hypothetical protein